MSLPKKYSYVFLEFFFGLITDLLFTQSAEDAESAVKFRIGPKGRVFAIGNGVDVEKFDPKKIHFSNIRSSFGIPADGFVIGMLCRLVKEKGIEEFLAAAKKITENQKNCYFLLIGERQDHDHAEGVDDIIELSKEALGDKLILTGYRTDIPKLLHAMDLYVLPSWREGMPRSIIEAMMIGVPVLATNIRGSREEVIHEVTGLLVPVKSPIALEHAMTKFICNPEWSRKLGMEGRRQALKHFNEQNVVELQLNLIEQFASRP